MAPAAPKSCTIILKLLVNPKRQKVLFAEAGKGLWIFFSLFSLCLWGLSQDFSPRMAWLDLAPSANLKPPMSTISSITLLNSFSVKDISALEVQVVELGMDEGVKLMKESLNSNSVLTNVFLGKKAAAVAALNCGANPKECCPECNQSMSSKVTYVVQLKTTVATSGSHAAGYVKDVVTYMIMDDLEPGGEAHIYMQFQASLCSTGSMSRMLVPLKRRLLDLAWMRSEILCLLAFFRKLLF
ncbi:hypothetical protein M0R45_037230 [Rubus argutus]|uniref:Cystatin domain-containing protein n=1 Tax=Rubus argutus TaxID=59490 RepID=A0AAW1VZN9_RUBAR